MFDAPEGTVAGWIADAKRRMRRILGDEVGT
jgi:hypothetical protein